MSPSPLLLPPSSAEAAVAPPPRRPLAGAAQALGLGLVIVVFQILLGCLLAGQADFPSAYLKLFCWDSGWFASVVEHGYVSPPVLSRDHPGNIAFFPAYPLSARLLQRATGWPTPVSLLLTAQLAAWGFWTYLILFFRRWHVPPALTALGVLLIASHPAAFYLVAGYTEPLFLFGLLGFLYWSAQGSAASLCLAALHGFIMTSTRFIGLAAVAYPLVHFWLNAPAQAPGGLRHRLARLLPALAVSTFAALGTVLYFLYCHYRFGQWDLYVKTSLVGWGTSTNYLAFFSWRTYCPQPPFLRDGFLNPIWFNQFLVPFAVILFTALFALEYRHCRPGPGWRFRAGLYTCAVLMFYVSVCANSTVGMYSMVRFLLGVEVLLVLAVIHWLARTRTAEGRPRRRWLLLGVWVVLSYLLQFWLTYRFTHGQWVA